MPNEEHFRKLERMYLLAPVNAYYRPQAKIGEGTAEVSVDVREDLFHAAGAVHGVSYFKLLDDSAFFAANSLVDDVFLLTVSFNIYFTRPVSSGKMIASARVVHRSRRLIVAEAVLRDSDGNQIAFGSGSFMRSTMALSEGIGYA